MSDFDQSARFYGWEIEKVILDTEFQVGYEKYILVPVHNLDEAVNRIRKFRGET